MNEKDLDLKIAEIRVRAQLTRVSDAKRELEEGYKKLQAEFEKDYGKLKSILDRERLELEDFQAKLDYAKECAAKKYE